MGLGISKGNSDVIRKLDELSKKQKIREIVIACLSFIGGVIVTLLVR